MIPIAFAPWLELISALSVLALELWVLKRPGESHLPANLARITVLVIWWLSWRRRRLSGVRPPSSPASTRVVVLTTASMVLLGVALLAVWGGVVREPYDEAHLFFRQLEVSEWPVWLVSRFLQALTQQIGLQLFLWPVCWEIFRRRSLSMAVAAAIFGLAHLPSPTLVAATGIVALLWIWLYQRGAGLLILTLSHLILSSLGLALLPERINYNMHVGRVALQRSVGYRALGEDEAKSKLRILCAQDSRLRAETDPEAWIEEVFRVNVGREPTRDERQVGTSLLQEGRTPCTVAKLFVSYPATGQPGGEE